MRLALRASVQTAESVVRHSLHQIRGVRVGLQNRHKGWEKGRVQKGKGLPDDGVLAGAGWCEADHKSRYGTNRRSRASNGHRHRDRSTE